MHPNGVQEGDPWWSGILTTCPWGICDPGSSISLLWGNWGNRAIGATVGDPLGKCACTPFSGKTPNTCLYLPHGATVYTMAYTNRDRVATTAPRPRGRPQAGPKRPSGASARQSELGRARDCRSRGRRLSRGCEEAHVAGFFLSARERFGPHIRTTLSQKPNPRRLGSVADFG
jgi:hypothetical protein